MSNALPLAATPRAPLPWSDEAIFAVMGEPGRRRIVKFLANGERRTASELCGATGKRLDATIKDCAALVKMGFLVGVKDANDARKRRYSLAPAVPLAKTTTGWELDFGCCVLRV